jgi:hypothetical protein
MAEGGADGVNYLHLPDCLGCVPDNNDKAMQDG